MKNKRYTKTTQLQPENEKLVLHKNSSITARNPQNEAPPKRGEKWRLFSLVSYSTGKITVFQRCGEKLTPVEFSAFS